MTDQPRTLTIDIGGTGTKMLDLGHARDPLEARHREPTPRPAHPGPVCNLIKDMLAQHRDYDRVSVGFPGVVRRGVVETAPNLDTAAWQGFDLGAALHELTGKPVRVLNDADLQGYGVISGAGVELVLTLGTGLGSGLYSDGHLVPNLELGHHPFVKGRTYEQRVSNSERKRIGNATFRTRVNAMLAQLKPIFNYERVFIGGGNAKKLDPGTLPDDVTLFTNVEGMRGGVRLWQDTGGVPHV